MSRPVRLRRFLRRVGWRMRALPGVVVTREWLIAVAFTVGMASLSAAFGIMPDLAEEGWSGNRRLPWLVSCGAVAVVMLTAGMTMWWFRNAVLHRRGTAYLVDLSAPGWDPEDKRAFRASIRSQFAAVRDVSGPDRLRGGRAWTLDGDGSRLWDEHLTDLVHSFRTLHANDDPATRNAVYLWAPWPVAFGFGLRTVGGHRGIRLEIRHRPSYGRAGEVPPTGFVRPGLTFPSASPASLTGTVTTRERHVRLRPDPAERAKGVTLLLVRTSGQPYGPLPAGSGFRVPVVPIRDAARIGLPGKKITVQEWTYRPPSRLVAWDEYPAVAVEAATWIRDRAVAAGPDTTILLGMLVPQELGAGIGIVAAAMPDWPSRLWPLIYDPETAQLTTVYLNLGRGRV